MGDVFAGGTVGAGSSGRAGAVVSALSPTTRPNHRPVINLATGVRWERLTATPDPLLEFLYVVYEVGSASCDEDSLLTHAGNEYGYVISGRLGIRIGFDEHELTAGSSISFDSTSPHRLWAIGARPVHAIWVVIGRRGDSRLLDSGGGV